MKRIVLSVVGVMMISGLHADITVSDVEVFSGHPWKEVVVGYTITGSDDRADGLRLTAMDKSTNKSYVAKTLLGATLTEGRHLMRWNAAADGIKLSSSNVEFVVSVVDIFTASSVIDITTVIDRGNGGVQLWENGPYWAECNVGATSPEEYGYYFWWGDTIGCKRVSACWELVGTSGSGFHSAFSFEAENCLTWEMNEEMLLSNGFIGSSDCISPDYDAATQYLGAPWRMPTLQEWKALIKNCDMVWTTCNGVSGTLVTGKGDYASRSIFLPASGYGDGSNLTDARKVGYYWSSTPHSSNQFYACGAYCHPEYGVCQDVTNPKMQRRCGRTVRPLRSLR